MSYNMYSGSNMDKLYISPYCAVEVAEDTLNIRQYLFNKHISVRINAVNARILLKKMDEGASREDLADVFTNCFQQAGKPMEFLYLLMQSGVLE